MSQQQQSLIQIIEAIYRDTYAPVKTVAVATRYGMCDRHVRRYLNQLEAAGAVKRVGQRCGWLPAAA